MKNLQIAGLTALTLLGSLSAIQAQEASTTPVGYTTETLAQGFNLIGLTLHQPVLTSGTFTAVADVGVTDTSADFITALGASGSATYILEIKTGALAGSIQDITTWTATTLDTPDDLLAAGLLVTDTYTIRKASTIADVFGADNSAGLTEGSSTTADIIWVPFGSGSFKKFYYAVAAAPFTTEGWKSTGTGNDDQSAEALIYTDGILIQRRSASELPITITGAVKEGNTSIFLSDQFTYTASANPAGTTLTNSGLTGVLSAGSSSTADIIWMPDNNGDYIKFYYAVAAPPFTTAGWKSTATGNVDQGDSVLTSGFIIQKRTVSDLEVTLTGPAL